MNRCLLDRWEGGFAIKPQTQEKWANLKVPTGVSLAFTTWTPRSDLDDLEIYFFRSAELAAHGARQIAAAEIYNAGDLSIVTTFDKTAGLQPPTNLAVAEDLETVYGNAVVAWSYPRTHRRLSEQRLRACLLGAHG